MSVAGKVTHKTGTKVVYAGHAEAFLGEDANAPNRKIGAFYLASASCVQHRDMSSSRQTKTPAEAGVNAWVIEGRSVVAAILAAGDQQDLTEKPRTFAHAVLDGRGDFGIVLEELAGILAPLPQTLAIPGEPGTGLFDNT